MAELTFRSPGVSIRTIDLSGPTALKPIGIPAGVISTTQYGPAFIPITVPTFADWRVVYGDPITGKKFGALAAKEWLRFQQSLTQIRVLGIGLGQARITSGNNKGKVESGGFSVGDQQPQSSLSGGLGNNAYAVAGSTAPAASGPLGRTFFLGCIMSQSTNSTFFTDAGLDGRGSVPIVRGILFAASGVLLTLSSSRMPNTSQPNVSSAADPTTVNIQGGTTGSVILSASRQDFTMLLNGHKGLLSTYPNVLTASFDPNSPNYFATTFNRDPLKLEEAGYCLYSHWDIFPAMAVPTGSGIMSSSVGQNVDGFENIAFLITGSTVRNSGSTTAPNFECFEDRFRTASTPWIISQTFGGSNKNLFRFHMLSDGEAANTRCKISIENLKPSNNDNYRYGTFDVLIRDFNDTDGNKAVMEAFRNVSLDPSSPRFIGRAIGTFYAYYNFDVSEESQKIVVDLDKSYPNVSKYVRVELATAVDEGEMEPTAMPVGFRGVPHLVTSGSSPLATINNTSYYAVSNWSNHIVQPPVPLRLSVAKGTGTAKYADRSLYWGIQFEQVTSALEPNSATAPNKSMYSWTKYFPNFHTEWMNPLVSNNEGTADTTENGILDADRFCNNKFSLENIEIYYSSTTQLADTNNLANWRYIRTGSITTNTTNYTRAFAVSDLLDPTVRTVAKFTTYFQGGFDGLRIFNTETKNMTNKAIVEEINNSSRGFDNGPTNKAFKKAIDISKDTLDIPLQLLTIPGIRYRGIVDYAVAAVENDRNDCMLIFDIEEKDSLNNTVLDETQTVNIKNTVNDFRGRGMNSSFAAAYFPDVIIDDPVNNTKDRVPPSVAVLGAFAKNDAVGYAWTAPAGFTRGTLETVQNSTIYLKRSNLDEIMPERLNTITVFAGEGPTVWGQSTMKATVGSPLEKVNVRRMMLALRREIKKVADKIMFQPNRTETIENFNSLCQPILKRFKDLGGVNDYAIQINTETTTQADIENKTIRGAIWVIPTRAIEAINLDFVVSNRANFLSA